MLYPYTTPYQRFSLPIDVSTVSQLYITYTQYSEILFEKTLEDCEIIDDHTIQVHLDQYETGRFTYTEHSSSKPEVQITFLTISGERLTSNPCKLDIGKINREGVLI